MASKNDRVCVSRYYPIDHIKPNRMYIVRYSNLLFIANGNIYVQIRNDGNDKQYCCTIHNFKKWGGMENLKKFVSLKGKKEVKTISDLMDAVLECGYSRELGSSEYMDIENDCLLENSDYKYNTYDLWFARCENLDESDGFKKKEYTKVGLQGRIEKYNTRNELEFCLDLGIGGIRKDLPECILKEIGRESNRLLESNLINAEDIKKVKFTCYAKVQLSHYYHYDKTIKGGKPQKNNHHVFYRSYSIHIEIDKIGDYYNDFDLDDIDIKFLKHADIYLCDRPGTWKPFDEFIRDEIFR